MRNAALIIIVAVITTVTGIATWLAPSTLASTEERPDPTPMMAAYNCNAADIAAVMGEGFTMQGEPRLGKWPYNGRGWGLTYVSYWSSAATENRGARYVTCLTVLYDNWASAGFENRHHSLRQWVEGNYDVEEFKVYSPPAIGHGFRAAGYRHTYTVREDYIPEVRNEAAAHYLRGPLGVYLYATEYVGENLNPVLAKHARQNAFERSINAVVNMGVQLDTRFNAMAAKESSDQDPAEAQSFDLSGVATADAKSVDLLRPR